MHLLFFDSLVLHYVGSPFFLKSENFLPEIFFGLKYIFLNVLVQRGDKLFFGKIFISSSFLKDNFSGCIIPR